MTMADTPIPADDLLIFPPAEGWERHGACRDSGLDFFLERGNTRTQAAACKAVCAGCAVRAECADFALNRLPTRGTGIWGGMTPAERRAIRSARLGRCA